SILAFRLLHTSTGSTDAVNSTLRFRVVHPFLAQNEANSTAVEHIIWHTAVVQLRRPNAAVWGWAMGLSRRDEEIKRAIDAVVYRILRVLSKNSLKENNYSK
ncbi:unnamed protein product, partial [Pylaiella littoralis]